MTSKGDTESCRLSVLAMGSVRKAEDTPGASLVTPDLELQCPRKSIVLSEEDYSLDGKSYSYSSSGSASDFPTNAEKIFAKEMSECWYKLGEGEVNIFGFGSEATSPATCMVCSSISFDSDVPQESLNLQSYLEETNTPITMQQSGQTTYYQYLYRIYEGAHIGQGVFNTGEKRITPYITEQGIISPSVSYSVVYYSFAGNYFLLVLPNDKIQDTCRIIEN